MEVRFSPDVQAKLDQLAVETGMPQEEFVCDALTGYLAELTQVRSLLDARYDDLKSGHVGLVCAEQVKVHFIGRRTA